MELRVLGSLIIFSILSQIKKDMNLSLSKILISAKFRGRVSVKIF